MLATYVSALLILLASTVVGRAVWRIAGAGERSWLEPVTGFAAIALAASAATRFLDSGGWALVVIAAMIAASLVILRGRAFDRDLLRIGLPVAAAAVFVASLPFLVSGRVGILGFGINNDLASHLLWAWWLQDQPAPIPGGLEGGYPIGPHSIAAALGTFDITMLRAIAGLMVAVTAMTAVSTLALTERLHPALRVGAGVLVAMPYLVASAFAVGGFKETVMAMLLLGFAIGLWRIERDWPGDRATPVALGVIFAGTLSAYSLQGTFWLIAAAGLLGAVGVARALIARDLPGQIRRAVPVLGPGVVLAGALALLEIERVRTFQDISGVSNTIAGDGKLRFTVSALEGLGAWPSSDFLLGTTDVSAPALFGAIGIAALLVAAFAWLGRGRFALLAAMLGAGVIYVGTLLDAGLYVQSKALAVPAPLVMLLILAGLLRAGTNDGDERSGGRSPVLIGLTAVFAAVAAYSSFLALRDAVVAPNERAEELAVLREQTEQGGALDENWTLSLTSDRFTDYQFRSVKIASPNRNAQQVLRALPSKDYRLPLDFDTVDSGTLDAFEYVLSTSAEYRSRRPPNLDLIDETDAYELWRVARPTPLGVRVFGEEARPGKVLGCGPGDVGDNRTNAVAALIIDPPPVIGKRGDWKPVGKLAPGDSATQTLNLPPGTWDLSIQYHSPLNPVQLSAPGYERELAPAMDGAIPFRLGQGPFWKGGRIESDGGPVTFEVSIGEGNFFQRLLGADRKAAIGNIVATSADAWRRVPFAQACGHYVDHYYIKGAAPKRKIDLPPRPLSELLALTERNKNRQIERRGKP